jgi:hypothetical protein
MKSAPCLAVLALALAAAVPADAQVVYTYSAPPVVVYSAPPPVLVPAAPVVTYRVPVVSAPVVTYSAPVVTYSAPVFSAPVVSYSVPVAPVVYSPGAVVTTRHGLFRRTTTVIYP